MHYRLFFTWVAMFLVSAAGASPSEAGGGGMHYAVVVSEGTLADESWADIVELLVDKYSGRKFVYRHPEISALREELSGYMPHCICIVAKPEEATIALIKKAQKTVQWLDDDPYDDALWAILTGYTVEDAMRIATADPLTVARGLSHVGSGWLQWFEEGLAFSEGEKNAKFVKGPGQESRKVRGPDDTTEEIVSALNSNRYHIMSSSGHATERDWMMGFGYKNGKIVSREGRLFGISSKGKEYAISTDNPKIYFSPGNCLIAHISHKGCMALAWIHSGANQFFGHIINQGRICTAWSIPSYFFGLQDRFTYAEAVYISRQSARSFLVEGEIDGMTQVMYSRCLNGTVLYGDPAWPARMKRTADPLYDQELKVEEGEDGRYLIKFKMKANRDFSFSHRSGGGPFAFLPVRVKNAEVVSGDAYRVVVADNFILMKMGEKGECKLKEGDERLVVVTAEPLAGWAYLQDDELPMSLEHIVAIQQNAMRLLQGKKYREAIEAYKSVLQRYPDDSNALYNTACAYSLLGEKEEAVQFLEKAVGAGFTDLDHIKKDVDLDNIREEEGYRKLIRGLEEEEAGVFEAEVEPGAARDYIDPERDAFEPPVKETGACEIKGGGSSGGMLAWGQGCLWIYRMGRVVKINHKSGLPAGDSDRNMGEAGAFAIDDNFLWAVSNQGISGFPERKGKTFRDFRFEEKEMATAGLACVGGRFYIGNRKTNRICVFDAEKGEKTGEFPAPSNDMVDLAAFDEYVMVADGKDKAVYLITGDGYVILSVKLDVSPVGVASDGNLFWVADALGKLREFKIDRTRKMQLGTKRLATVEYRASHGPEGYIAVPWNMNRQKILGNAQIAPSSPVEMDAWGQPSVKSKRLKVTAAMYDIRYYIWPDKVGGMADIPEHILKRYLVDGEMLEINDPEIRKGKEWITRGGKENDYFRLVQRAYRYATEKAYYEKDRRMAVGS